MLSLDVIRAGMLVPTWIPSDLLGVATSCTSVVEATSDVVIVSSSYMEDILAVTGLFSLVASIFFVVN